MKNCIQVVALVLSHLDIHGGLRLPHHHHREGTAGHRPRRRRLAELRAGANRCQQEEAAGRGEQSLAEALSC